MENESTQSNHVIREARTLFWALVASTTATPDECLGMVKDILLDRAEADLDEAVNLLEEGMEATHAHIEHYLLTKDAIKWVERLRKAVSDD